jgi:hypothetical protein
MSAAAATGMMDRAGLASDGELPSIARRSLSRRCTMDGEQFDALSRRLQPGQSRRALVGALASGVAGTLPLAALAGRAAAKRKKKKKKPAATPPAPCVPDCGSKQCGGDGCGGSCGTCQANETCDNGACVCAQPCGNKNCGQDGCGKSCGTCQSPRVCQNGRCVEPCGNDFCEQGERCLQSGQVIGCVVWEATCKPRENSCSDNQAIQCQSRSGDPGFCFLSADGQTRCGSHPPPGVQCGQCNDDNDCANFGFGAFCLITLTNLGSDFCACQSAGMGFCYLPVDR